MRKILGIAIWEFKKIFFNWRKALVSFLLPAILMMAALTVFPRLVDYLTTGSFGKKPILMTNPPKSFVDYIDKIDGTTDFKFQLADKSDKKEIEDNLSNGYIYLAFSVNDDEDSQFDNSIASYYTALLGGDMDANSGARIHVIYNREVFTNISRAYQLEEVVLEPYSKSLLDALGGDYVSLGKDIIEINAFNPVDKLLDYRTVANRAASAVIPGVLILLMYYCCYSLGSDMFASERDRGFWNKLMMTPVNKKSFFMGKTLAIVSIVSASAIITFIMMFFASWLNRSNDALSLLPFGMLLTPMQLVLLVLILPVTAFIMAAMVENIIFELRKMSDIIMFLQFPLVLLLFDFFLMMFRGTRPVGLEYLIPVHNSTCLMRDIFMSEEKLWHIIAVFTVNILIGIHVFNKTIRKEGSK